MHLDEVDRAILQALKEDSRLSLRKLAQHVHMTPPAVAERVRRLEDQQIITGYTILVDENKLNPGLTAYINVYLSNGEGIHRSFLRFAEEREEVCECYQTVGDSCYLLKVAVPDHAHLNAFIEALLTYGNYRLNLVTAEPIKKSSSVYMREYA